MTRTNGQDVIYVWKEFVPFAAFPSRSLDTCFLETKQTFLQKQDLRFENLGG